MKNNQITEGTEITIGGRKGFCSGVVSLTQKGSCGPDELGFFFSGIDGMDQLFTEDEVYDMIDDGLMKIISRT